MEAVSQFKEITGCVDDNEAHHFLAMYDNDVNRAIDRYFHQESRLGASSNGASRQAHDDSIEIIEEMDTNEPTSSRRRQPIRSTRGQQSGPAVLPAPDVIDIDEDQDSIRRPMPKVNARLVNETFDQSWRAATSRPTGNIFQAASDFRQLAREQEEQLRANRNRPIFADPTLDRKAKNLSMLFQPPVDIIFRGTWESARQSSSMDSKWLLVNLQRNNEFQCSCLNRDIWAKDSVKEVVMKNFVFWQVSDDVPDCKRVAAYYNISSFPAVFIVDPRTGEVVFHVTRLKDTSSFLEQLMSFLDRSPDFETYDQHMSHDMCRTPFTPNDSIMADASPVATRTGVKRKATEDEPGTSKRFCQSTDVPQNDKLGIDELCDNGTKLTTVDREEWRNFLGPQSSTSAQVHVGMHFPNNERERIEVPDTTQLKALFVLIDGRGFNSREHLFVLNYPRREFTLDRHGHQTLRELGFEKQEFIHVDRK